MATYSGVTAVHEALTASTVDTVTLNSPTAGFLTIVNRTGTAEIYLTYSKGGTPATPTVGGVNCLVLPAAICSLTIEELDSPLGNVAVSLISSGAMAYSVEAI